MSILGRIKDRFARNGDSGNYSEIRSHVLGEPRLGSAYTDNPDFVRPGSEPRFGRQSVPTQFTGELGPPASPDELAAQGFQPREPKGFETRKGFEAERFSMEGGDTDVGPYPRSPYETVEKEGSSKDYEILDRLNIIEAQLGAIRAQTETINERLKNMEMKLGSRRF